MNFRPIWLLEIRFYNDWPFWKFFLSEKVNFLIHWFQMNRFLDFHITCGDDDIRVHRFMLAANSHYFHGMFERAAEASHILLPHTAISPRFVRLIIDLIYTGVARMKRKVCYSYHSNFGLSLLSDSNFDDRKVKILLTILLHHRISRLSSKLPNIWTSNIWKAICFWFRIVARKPKLWTTAVWWLQLGPQTRFSTPRTRLPMQK